MKHTYSVGDKVLVKNDQLAKYAKVAYKGPYKILAVHNNGTVSIQIKNIIDRYNIRNIYPYKE